jgi:hypothetical protein
MFQRRIHSLLRADGTLPHQIRNELHSPQQADGTLPDHIRNEHHSPERADGTLPDQISNRHHSPFPTACGVGSGLTRPVSGASISGPSASASPATHPPRE